MNVLKDIQEDFHMLQIKLIVGLWKNEFELPISFFPAYLPLKIHVSETFKILVRLVKFSSASNSLSAVWIGKGKKFLLLHILIEFLYIRGRRNLFPLLSCQFS